ncbi:MAG: hypothetical protein AB8B50_06840 [Pirellulaceae bacterium]
MYRSISATSGYRTRRRTEIKSVLPAVVAIVALTTLSGCKTLSWKPSGKLFAWGKEPSGPAEGAEGLVLPTSPATKYSPTAMASLGAKEGASAATQTPSSPYGYTGQTTGTPKAGLAAQANGYQTGPYQMGSSPAAGTGSPGANLAYTGKTTFGNKSVPPAMSNPYGGPDAFGVAGGSNVDVALPKSVSQALSQNKTIPSAYPALPNAASVAGGTANIQAATGASTPKVSLPSYTTPAPSNATTGNSSASYPSMPSVGASTKPAPSAYSGVSVGGAAATGIAPATEQATTPSSTTTPFTPGTTGRPNRYSFGN